MIGVVCIIIVYLGHVLTFNTCKLYHDCQTYYRGERSIQLLRSDCWITSYTFGIGRVSPRR